MVILHASIVIGHENIRINQNLTLTPLLLITTLVAGLRYQTGGDWQVYQEWYTSFSLDSILSFGVEPGWIAYSLLLRELGFGFDLYLLATAVLSNFLIRYGLARLLADKRMAAICFGFYCLIVFYSAQMFYIRAGLATGLFLSAVAISRERKLSAGAILLAAISIHFAVALAALIYACMRLCTRSRLLLMLSVFGLMVLFSFVSGLLLPDVYVAGEFSEVRSLTLKSAFGLILLIVVIIKLDNFKQRYSPEAAAIAVAALTIPYLFESFEVGGRVRMFFSPIDGLPIYFLVRSIAGRRYAVGPLLAIIGMFVFIYWTDPYVLELFTPYQTWLSKLF
jgi:hypothetical protein